MTTDDIFLVGHPTDETRSTMQQLFQSPEIEIIYSPILYATDPRANFDASLLLSAPSLPTICMETTESATVRNPATGIEEFVVYGRVTDEIYRTDPGFRPYFVISTDVERGRSVRRWVTAQQNMLFSCRPVFTFVPQLMPCSSTLGQHWNRATRRQ